MRRGMTEITVVERDGVIIAGHLSKLEILELRASGWKRQVENRNGILIAR
ncbi:hypothetical protein [Domibacillus aminovorans]|nr:hypothetical protein [Domibacillus aminovorans]